MRAQSEGIWEGTDRVDVPHFSVVLVVEAETRVGAAGVAERSRASRYDALRVAFSFCVCEMRRARQRDGVRLGVEQVAFHPLQEALLSAPLHLKEDTARSAQSTRRNLKESR